MKITYIFKGKDMVVSLLKSFKAQMKNRVEALDKLFSMQLILTEGIKVLEASKKGLCWGGCMSRDKIKYYLSYDEDIRDMRGIGRRLCLP